MPPLGTYIEEFWLTFKWVLYNEVYEGQKGTTINECCISVPYQTHESDVPGTFYDKVDIHAMIYLAEEHRYIKTIFFLMTAAQQ